jgi:hypothetical protein
VNQKIVHHFVQVFETANLYVETALTIDQCESVFVETKDKVGNALINGSIAGVEAIAIVLNSSGDRENQLDC